MSSAGILAQIQALQAKIAALKEAIRNLNNASSSFSQFPPVLEEIGAGWKNSIVINGEPADKGKALETICDMNDFSMENVMAFGDSQNDISMLEKAGIGVAMGNALQEVKEMADIVTLDNNSNGIGIVIDQKVLGKKIDNL